VVSIYNTDDLLFGHVTAAKLSCTRMLPFDNLLKHSSLNHNTASIASVSSSDYTLIEILDRNISCAEFYRKITQNVNI
jgi:hypothetical protein